MVSFAADVSTGEIIARLRDTVKGPVIAAGDADYDRLRTPFYGGFDRHPVAIVKVADAADVAAVVTIARETHAPLAVRSGGHSMAAHSVPDGGILLDLVNMKGLEIDPANRTAWAQTGLTAGEFTAAVGAHGLAVGFGDTASVGIGGITLGGGVGFLSRKHGLTIDSVLAAEIVTADGAIRTVDAANHPDLYWAIRGGGGNFGVVTRILYRLHPVSQIVGGMLILPGTPEIVGKVVKAAEDAPEDFSAIINVMVAPPAPFVPPAAHGKLIAMILLVYAGDDVAEGERVVAPFRAIAEPIADMVKPMTYPEMFPHEEGEFHPIAAGHNLFRDTFDADTVDTIFTYIGKSTAMMSAAQIRVLGGAIARVPADATAYAHRDRHIMMNVAAMTMNPADLPTHAAWVRDFAAALQEGDGGAYVNFVGDEGADRVREAYPGGTYARLAQIKRAYDPGNLFRLNHNIAPAEA